VTIINGLIFSQPISGIYISLMHHNGLEHEKLRLKNRTFRFVKFRNFRF